MATNEQLEGRLFTSMQKPFEQLPIRNLPFVRRPGKALQLFTQAIHDVSFCLQFARNALGQAGFISYSAGDEADSFKIFIWPGKMGWPPHSVRKIHENRLFFQGTVNRSTFHSSPSLTRVKLHVPLLLFPLKRY